jgi:uncharacterized protein (UPF0305 family)
MEKHPKLYWILNGYCDPRIVTSGTEIKFHCAISSKLDKRSKLCPRLEIYTESGEKVKTIKMDVKSKQTPKEFEVKVKPEFKTGAYLAVLTITNGSPCLVLTFDVIEEALKSTVEIFGEILNKRIKARETLLNRNYNASIRYLSEILRSYLVNKMYLLAELTLLELEGILSKQEFKLNFAAPTAGNRNDIMKQGLLKSWDKLEHVSIAFSQIASKATVINEGIARWIYSAYEDVSELSKNYGSNDKAEKFYETATLFLVYLADTIYARRALEHYIHYWQIRGHKYEKKTKNNISNLEDKLITSLLATFVRSVSKYSRSHDLIRIRSIKDIHSIFITNSGIPIKPIGTPFPHPSKVINSIKWWNDVFSANGCQLNVEYDNVKDIGFRINLSPQKNSMELTYGGKIDGASKK